MSQAHCYKHLCALPACFKINNLFFPSRFWHQSFPPPTLPISSYNPHNTAAHFLCSGLAVSEDECCNKSVNLSRIFNSQKISTVGVTKYPTFLQRPVAPTLLFPHLSLPGSWSLSVSLLPSDRGNKADSGHVITMRLIGWLIVINYWSLRDVKFIVHIISDRK